MSFNIEELSWIEWLRDPPEVLVKKSESEEIYKSLRRFPDIKTILLAMKYAWKDRSKHYTEYDENSGWK